MDTAQQTCGAVFAQPFAYDVPFDAWTTRLLTKRILLGLSISHRAAQANFVAAITEIVTIDVSF